MSQIHIWQILVDAGLVTTILFVSAKWIKGGISNGLSQKLIDLEGSLRGLIAEADAAGRTLNDQLLRREQNLERLLNEVEGTERRIQQSLVDFEAKRNELIQHNQKPKRMVEDPAIELKVARPKINDNNRIEVIEPLEFVDTPTPKKVPQPSQRRGNTSIQEALQKKSNSERAARLKPQIEVTNEIPNKSTLDHMRAVYAQAELMIKQGERLELISAQTEIPEQELILLSQMIEVEREEEERLNASSPTSRIDRDSRLGILGSMKRQVQTL